MALSRPVTSGLLAVLLLTGSTHQRLPAKATLQHSQAIYAELEQLDERRQGPGYETEAAIERAHDLNQQAVELYQQGHYREAESLFRQALAIYHEQSREHHPDAAISLSNLAELYRTQGRYREAEHYFLQALAILREQLGEDHPLVATNLNNLAELYRAQGRYREAEPRFLQALEIYQAALGEQHPDVAASLNNLGGLYQSQGRYSEAEASFLKALDIYRVELDEHHPLVATGLNNLALLYQAQGHYDKAEPLFLQALDIYQERLGEHHVEVAITLNNQAELYRIQGRYREAEPLFLESLAMLRNQLEPQHPFIASNLNNLALLYQAQGRYSEVEPLLVQSVEIYRAQLGENHPDTAQGLNNLAELYRIQGRYHEAETLLFQALEILREQLGEQHPLTTTSLNNLAVLYQTQSRYGEAEPLFLQTLEVLQGQLGEQHTLVANSLNNLAELYRAQGRYSEADPLLLQALEIYQEQLGHNHPNVATSLNNLAQQYSEQGRGSEAEPLFLQALAIYREQVGEHHPAMAQSLNNLAGLYQGQGRYDEAAPLLHQALEIYRQQLGEHHPEVAISLNNLAELNRAQGHYDEAETLLIEALKILREQLGENHPLTATSLNNLALIYHSQKRYEEAELLLVQALNIRREQLGEHHPEVAISLSNLSVLHQAKGDIEMSMARLKAGLDIEEWNLDLNLAALTDAQRQVYAATIAHTVDLAISLHLQAAPDTPEAAQLALTTLLRRKGRILESGVDSLHILRQNLTPEDRATLDELSAVQQNIAALIFDSPSGMAPEAYRDRLEQLETNANHLEATLVRRSAAFRASSEPLELATVHTQLPANGVLVEYIRYSPLDANDVMHPWGDARYAAYLLFPDGRIEAIDLGSAAAIDHAVQAFSRDLRIATAPIETSARDTQAGENLATLIFDPIAPYLTEQEHLLISPDSQLNRIPFEALQTGDTGNYLVQHYQISYLTSGRDLLKSATAPPSTAPALILADPDYDVTDTAPIANGNNRRSAELSQLEVNPLPGTAAEAAAIAPLLPDARVLTNEQATENVLKEVQAPQILHIATHGFFLEDVTNPTANSRGLGVELSGGLSTSPSANPAALRAAVENPLLRSGLALAGFNTRSSGDEDGVLTALEAANLNLSGTQLVVLSACETGLGDIVNGDGVYGLRRSFAIAGAESQLMSLWLVSDDGTQALMARYYEKLVSGMGRSEALRETQLAMIAEGGQYSHPYYWAPFILVGDWRPLE